jgi:hypothetical protein
LKYPEYASEEMQLIKASTAQFQKSQDQGIDLSARYSCSRKIFSLQRGKGVDGVLCDFPLTLQEFELEINPVLEAAKRYLWKYGGTIQNVVFGMKKK